MIYEKPIFRPLGDCYLAVEFGDEARLSLNFRVLALEDRIRQAKIPGIIETIPSLRELALQFDRSVTSHARLQAALAELVQEAGDPATLPSRLVTLPCWYNDPWSAELARRFNVENNIEFVARCNDMTVEEVIRTHTATDYWVVCVGFTPGCYFSRCLDASKWLKAPKYRTPRHYTPARLIALAGFSTGAYPVASPGGYQVIGRLAANIYEPVPRNKGLPEDGVLLKAGDRLRYKPVDAMEYDDIWDAVQRGEYVYDIRDEVFDVTGYLASGVGGP
ncbi:MAG: allophanate hydrolase subunit 1 [Dongiaceae bacterium]